MTGNKRDLKNRCRISLQIFSISLNKLQSTPFFTLFQQVVPVIEQAEQDDGDNDGDHHFREDDVHKIISEIHAVSHEETENVDIHVIEQLTEKRHKDRDQRHIGR